MRSPGRFVQAGERRDFASDGIVRARRCTGQFSMCSDVRQMSPGNRKRQFRTIGVGHALLHSSSGVGSLNEHPVLRISPADLESLLGTLEVNFVALTECLVSTGYSLELGGVNAP